MAIEILTEFHQENFRKLSYYLAQGKLKADFGMLHICHPKEDMGPTCGAYGCALGHGPYAGIEKLPEEDFVMYAYRCFGVKNSLHFASIGQWEWCFDWRWYKRDDTPEGAALRINHMLQHGVPEDAYEQLMGRKKLCY